MKTNLDKKGRAVPRSSYWLIVKHHGLSMSVFVLELDAEKVLPVFGHVEEAEIFLRELGSGGWQIRETGVGEIVSVLFGPCANVSRIVLDPPAHGASAEVLTRLMSLGRKEFVASLTSETKYQTRR